jgi:hypothetical protein
VFISRNVIFDEFFPFFGTSEFFHTTIKSLLTCYA